MDGLEVNDKSRIGNNLVPSIRKTKNLISKFKKDAIEV